MEQTINSMRSSSDASGLTRRPATRLREYIELLPAHQPLLPPSNLPPSNHLTTGSSPTILQGMYVGTSFPATTRASNLKQGRKGGGGGGGLPIWFTEVDVCSINEHVRADDLEVVMREAFAHPGVEGIMLWGFWESFMSRENCHLVDAQGEVNEAGKRLIQLKKEWLSQDDGWIDEQSEFSFRGFEGEYQVEIQNGVVKTFVVHKQPQQQQQVVYVD